jgi:hypothetical protein
MSKAERSLAYLESRAPHARNALEEFHADIELAGLRPTQDRVVVGATTCIVHAPLTIC